jgi:hypothetical protein
MKSTRNRRKNVGIAEKFRLLAMAIDFMDRSERKQRLDVIGMACAFSSQPKLKREDFRQLAGMSIKQVVEELNLHIKA